MNDNSSNTQGFEPNPAIDAQIERKLSAAFAAGNLGDPDKMSIDDYDAIMSTVGITPEEQIYMAKRNVYRMAQVAIGQRIVKALDEHCKVAHADIIPCLAAYFEAKANGEVPA